jgi:hypothetical protein
MEIHFHPMFSLDEEAHLYFSIIGRALYTAQHLEMNCRAIVGFIHMIRSVTKSGSDVLDDPDFHDQIEHIWKQTLGRHVSVLKDYGFFDEDLRRLLGEAVDARNEIAHFITIGIDEHTDFGSINIFDDIKPLIRKIATADKFMSGLLQFLNKDPLPVPDYFLTYENRVMDWVLAPASFH